MGLRVVVAACGRGNVQQRFKLQHLSAVAACRRHDQRRASLSAIEG